MTDDVTTYKIVRFRFKDEPEDIVRGLTLEQAQAHCQREDTHGEGWFDGYTEDGSE
jgi:hypothetical protein